MLTINDLEIIDNEIFNDFVDSTQNLSELLKGNFKYTAEVCFMYMNNTDFIKMSILDNIKKENFYSANILYRSMIEHFLRFNFYFFNFALNGKTDSYSHKFRTALEFNDKISISKSINSVDKTNNKESKSNSQINQEIYDSKKDYQDYNLNELINFANTLSIKNIINFTEKNLEKTGAIPVDFLKKLIVQYSKLSSYVHGGMFAHRELVEFSVDKDKLERLTVMFGLSLQAATFVKMYSYIVLHTHEPRYMKYYSSISNSIMKMKE